MREAPSSVFCVAFKCSYAVRRGWRGWWWWWGVFQVFAALYLERNAGLLALSEAPQIIRFRLIRSVSVSFIRSSDSAEETAGEGEGKSWFLK